jgi:hypothetical protein
MAASIVASMATAAGGDAGLQEDVKQIKKLRRILSDVRAYVCAALFLV